MPKLHDHSRRDFVLAAGALGAAAVAHRRGFSARRAAHRRHRRLPLAQIARCADLGGAGRKASWSASKAAKLRESFAIPNKPKNLAETRKDWGKSVPVWIKVAVDLDVKLD